ncbi:PEPxxWA-CTERM sorting domain-containing protein [Phenylobacterium sp.]|uniref:PEPxxWA-CTERM sorting domain-containing protein n=1 Tax=Phenylobacterium sp. TaxID=1871053 RepID=UPI002869EFE9|nr:PEPxxWA-CTERM sorting domain-containing protein [Phenylobacterium sp.]
MRIRGLTAAVAAALTMSAGAASAAVLGIGQTTSVASGIAAFGPSMAQITWKHMFAPGTVWPSGALGPLAGGGVQIDPATGSSVSGNLATANWIEGPGFNDGPGGVGPELAISGPEDFTLTFFGPVTRIGLTIATGLGNLPHEFDHLGAVFNLTASNGDTGVLTLVDSGAGYSAWVTITSATPFSSLTFFEPSRNIQDQYFGDVLSAAGVPEPSTWAMMLAGLGLAGAALRRRRFQAA